MKNRRFAKVGAGSKNLPIRAEATPMDGLGLAPLSPVFAKVELTEQPIRAMIVLEQTSVSNRMQALSSSVVAVSLLFHAAFGCCWHHLHETAGEGQPEFGHAIAAEADHHHADSLAGCESHDCNSPHSPGKSPSDCHGTCNYLPPQKTQLDTYSALASLDLAVVTITTIDVRVMATAQALPTLAEPPQPPVRLHLFQQLLLI